MKNLPKPPFLCLVTNRNKTCGRPITDIVKYAIDGGVNIVQIREKDLNDDELYELSFKIKNIIKKVISSKKYAKSNKNHKNYITSFWYYFNFFTLI